MTSIKKKWIQQNTITEQTTLSPPTTKMSNESGAKKQYGPVKNPYANTLRNYFEYLKKESKSLVQRSRKQSLDGFRKPEFPLYITGKLLLDLISALYIF